MSFLFARSLAKISEEKTKRKEWVKPDAPQTKKRNRKEKKLEERVSQGYKFFLHVQEGDYRNNNILWLNNERHIQLIVISITLSFVIDRCLYSFNPSRSWPNPCVLYEHRTKKTKKWLSRSLAFKRNRSVEYMRSGLPCKWKRLYIECASLSNTDQ